MLKLLNRLKLCMKKNKGCSHCCLLCEFYEECNAELKFILSSRRIALEIVELLKEDDLIHRDLNHL